MADISEHIMVCCEELHEAIGHKLIGGLDNFPFMAERKTPPTVYIFNDGGHGGSYKIKYCPFCGLKLEFKKEEKEEKEDKDFEQALDFEDEMGPADIRAMESREEWERDLEDE